MLDAQQNKHTTYLCSHENGYGCPYQKIGCLKQLEHNNEGSPHAAKRESGMMLL